MLNSEDYCFKLDHIIDDPTNFIKVNTDGKVHPLIAKENSIIVMQEASDAHSKTADSDTVSTYQVSSVQLVTDKFN